MTLESPAFAFTLDTADGLRAVSWENKLTGRKLSLGNGAEVELDIGLPDQPLTTPKLRVVKMARSLERARAAKRCLNSRRTTRSCRPR